MDFNEKDCVFRGESEQSVINEYINSGADASQSGLRNDIEKLLKASKKDKKMKTSSKHKVDAFFDNERKEYFIIKRNFYDPKNVIAVLYEQLLESKIDENEDLAYVEPIVNAYIGEVEKKEAIDLSSEKSDIIHIALEMKETLAMTAEDELSESELHKLCEEIDERFYEPLSKVLEDVLMKLVGFKKVSE